MFVPPAKDPHAKRDEGKEVEWRSGIHPRSGTQSATGTPTVHPHSLISFFSISLPSHIGYFSRTLFLWDMGQLFLHSVFIVYN